MPLREEYNAEGARHFPGSNLAGGSWNGTSLSGAQIFDRFLEAYTALSRREPWLQASRRPHPLPPPSARAPAHAPPRTSQWPQLSPDLASPRLTSPDLA